MLNLRRGVVGLVAVLLVSGAVQAQAPKKIDALRVRAEAAEAREVFATLRAQGI